MLFAITAIEQRPTPRSAPVEGVGWLPQIPAQRTGEIPVFFIFNVNQLRGTTSR